MKNKNFKIKDGDSNTTKRGIYEYIYYVTWHTKAMLFDLAPKNSIWTPWSWWNALVE